MPTEPNLATSASMSPDILAVYMMDELLERAEKDTVFWNLAEKSTIPKGSGKTAQFTRYERLPLPEAPLEESVTPQATPITLSTVDAVLDQWGAVVSMSDIVVLVIKHPLVQQARELLTLQHNELVDREVQVVAMGSSNIYFAANRASRAALTQADVIVTDDVRRIVANLRSAGAPTYEGGRFRGVVDPFVEMDISKDSTFQLAGVFSQVGTLKDADIGRWMGVDWMRSNFIPVITLMSASYYNIPVAGGAVPPGATGFPSGGTGATRVVVTRMDPLTGFETQIGAETQVTGAAAYAAAVSIQGAAPSGSYRVYCSQPGGATGTATLQVRIRHTAGNTDTVNLVAGGAPTTAGTYVITGSGPVAPPIPPAVNIHISYVMGRGYLGATTLDALKTYIVPATASESDPLAQRTKAGWKQMFKALVLNPVFGTRVESASAFG